jgi:hypothetical protein
VEYCKRCKTSYGGRTRKYHVNCPASASYEGPTKEQVYDRHTDRWINLPDCCRKCPDCGLSVYYESGSQHDDNCPLGANRVVSRGRGLKTYKNQSVCVSVLDRLVTSPKSGLSYQSHREKHPFWIP